MIALQNRAGVYGKSIGSTVQASRKPSRPISLKWSDVDPIRPFSRFSRRRLDQLCDTFGDIKDVCKATGDLKRYRAAETLWNACQNETDRRDGFRADTELIISDAEFWTDNAESDGFVGDPR